MLKRKIKLLTLFLTLLGMSSCISNRLMSIEHDDVYFTSDDVMTEREWERYQESLTNNDDEEN